MEVSYEYRDQKPQYQIKCSSPISGLSFLPAVVILLILSIVLAGCGKHSLFGLLENEEPGDFAVSPGNANLAANTSLTIQGHGGFKPYSYIKISGEGNVDGKSGIYQAPSSIVGDSEEVEIEASDYFGSKDRTNLKVYNRLQLVIGGAPVTQVTMLLGDPPLDFDASGGIPSYTFSANGSADDIDVDGIFSPSAAGTYLIEVLDSIDNSASATVTVVDPAGALAISPTATYVVLGSTVDFKGLNITGSHLFEVDPAGAGSFVDPYANPATYVPPSTETVATVRLTDDSLASVTATVYVVASPPDPLSISPSSFGESIKWGEEIIFTAAGGIPPYTFWVEANIKGTIEKLDSNKALYTAPEANGVNWVWLTDSLGPPLRVKVRIKD